MKVIHVIDSGGFYGAEVMLLNLCMEQMRQGITVEVLSIGTPNSPPKAIEIKLRDANVPCKTWHMLPLPDLRQSLKIFAYCKSAKADVIHSHGYKGNILLGIIPKKWRGIPTIATVHGYTRQLTFSKLKVYQWLDRLCLRLLDAVVLVSESVRAQIDAHNFKNPVHVINNGIQENAESKGTYKSLFNEGELKIGALGRLSHEKNFSALIDAMPEIVKRHPNAKLVIYGEGGERTLLENKIKELGLEAAIKLPGYLDDTHPFLTELDLFINSSITEGMPISILEAMRAGTNIIATNIPANNILVGNAKHVNQTCSISSSGIADAVIGFCKETAVAVEQQSKANRALFIENYTLEKMTAKYSALYRTLLNTSS